MFFSPFNRATRLCAHVLLCAEACVVCECLSFQSGVSMELSCLGQTSGSVGREPWVNFKLLPPSRRKRPRRSVQQIGCAEHVPNCVGKRTKKQENISLVAARVT